MTESIEIPNIADVIPEKQKLEGKKMAITDIINLQLVFTGWEIDQSKFKENGIGTELLTLQFELDGEKHIVFTGSKVLIDQIRKLEQERNDIHKFRGTIRKINNKFLKFSK